MISATNIVMPRFQLAVLAALLCPILEPVAMPTIVSAAEQDTQRRHSLIHRSSGETAALPATTQGTIIQPPGSEPPQIVSPTEPAKASGAPPFMSLPHHRTLTKRPAIASVTAPAPSAQTMPEALTSGMAIGQALQTMADTSKDAPLTPITKSTAASHPGIATTGAGSITPTSPPPLAGAANVRASASAGSGSAPAPSGSRSALNLLQNSAIANLLQPPTPVVTTPPSPPPSSPPPSTPPSTPPSSPSTENVTLTWTANGESDLAGYKIYVGTASGTYSFSGSPFIAGKVTSYTISNLPKGQTYFFAMSAYDNAGNESALSAEVSKSLF